MKRGLPEYGVPLRNLAWAVGQWVWLRVATGPQMVRVECFDRGRVEIQPLYPDAMPMIVPAERLAWTAQEAMTA